MNVSTSIIVSSFSGRGFVKLTLVAGHVLFQAFSHSHQTFEDLHQRQEKPDLSLWTWGFALGGLAAIAERDKTLALTGLAHLCFLLPLFTQRHSADRTYCEACDTWGRHRCAMKAYRARARIYRAQGKNFAEAQQLTLC